MDKPTGTYQCLACGRVCDGSKLIEDVRGPVWTCEDATCGGTCYPFAAEKRYDVVVFEIETRKITDIVGQNLGETGFHTVDKRLGTILPRLNDSFDAEAVPTGKFKAGDILPSAQSLREMA
jgi:hypothetical protein